VKLSKALRAASKPSMSYGGASTYVVPSKFSTDKKPAVWALGPTEPFGTRKQTMFAVIKSGGKQYSVAPSDEVTVMSLAGEPGDKVTFGEVLMIVGDDETNFGAPFIAGASVSAEIVGHSRGPKVISFKKRRRQNSKRKRGHRQDLTLVRITEVLTGGTSASKQA
jgi:large subunit ribosomal protein L21